MAGETRIQGIVWEFVHDGENAEPPVDPDGHISYQAVEVAFSEKVFGETISYQAVEVAFSEVPIGHSTFYGDILEVAWLFGSFTPTPGPGPIVRGGCGKLVNPDFSINTYGLRTLSCERMKAAGVEQVPFRLAHQTNLGLRRDAYPPGPPVEQTEGILYETVLEAAWVYTGG